jgi:sortase A
VAGDATSVVDPVADPPPSPQPSRWPRVAGVLGELLVTAGVIVGLYLVYLLFGTGLETARAQDELRDALVADWSAPPRSDETSPRDEWVPPALGDGFALISSPAMGERWVWVVVEGVTPAALTRGPGHYPESGRPGEDGVVAVAGHRATHGEPFAHLDRLAAGDDVQLEVADAVYTYTVRETRLVAPTDTWVLQPREGIERGLTLTTCHPRWGSSRRLVVWAEQTGVEPKR